jgi:hypothetical protein
MLVPSRTNHGTIKSRSFLPSTTLENRSLGHDPDANTAHDRLTHAVMGDQKPRLLRSRLLAGSAVMAIKGRA